MDPAELLPVNARRPFTALARRPGLGVFASLAAGPLTARDIFVEAPVELARALKPARCGDTVTLTDGDWQDTRLVVTQRGSAGKPLEIRTEKPGP